MLRGQANISLEIQKKSGLIPEIRVVKILVEKIERPYFCLVFGLHFVFPYWKFIWW